MISVIGSTYSNSSILLASKQYVLGCSVMLCSAKIEIYIEDFFDSWISKVNISTLNSSMLPDNLKALYLNQPFLINSFKKLLYENNESKFLDILTSELSNSIFNLTDLSKSIPTLYSNHIYLGKKYPSPENLVSLYKRIGISNIFTQINSMSRSDLKSLLISFNNLRTEISHGGIPVGINEKDIIRKLKSVKKIVSWIDKAVYKQIRVQSSISTWPS